MLSAVILLVTISFSYLLNMILLRFSRNFGVKSRQNQNAVRWASTSKPTTGGISFYITFLLASIFLLVARPEVVAEGYNSYLALLVSATMAFLIGFADDAYNTNPKLKLAGQIGCGLTLLAFGVQIHFFGIYALDALLTVFWVVGIMNSLNMLDNMDGVTTTISLTIIAVVMSMIVAVDGISNLFLIVVAIVGSFVGFLFWNWKPARIYMGDTGSMFIGMVLAFIGIVFFWNIETSPDNVSYIRRGLIPVMVFIVPIMDTSFVTFARLARGSSPLVGGKDHLTHHLAHVGIPESLVPVALGLVSVISGGLAMIAFMLIREWQPLYSVLFGAIPVLTILFFFLLYKRGEKIGKVKDLYAERERHRLAILAEKEEASIEQN